jgi:PilZ domain
MARHLEKTRDLRRATRVKVQVPARYISEHLTIDGTVTDLSPDGVFFCSDYLDAMGELVRISIEVPWQDRPLHLRGEVRWVSESPRTGGMGIRFMDVSFEDRVVLSSLGVSGLAEGLSATVF